jgi:hypothetical protein
MAKLYKVKENQLNWGWDSGDVRMMSTTAFSSNLFSPYNLSDLQGISPYHCFGRGCLCGSK